MKRQKGGIYIGPWTLRIMLGLVGLAITALLLYEAPDLRRYIKFETM